MYLNRLLWYEKEEKNKINYCFFARFHGVFWVRETGFHSVHHGLHLRIHLQWGVGTAIPFTARTPEISSNSSSTFSANNTRKDKVEEVNLQSMRLEIKTPADADFDFLNEITISINADGLSEKVIATKTNIPEERLTSLEMDVEGSVNLKDYVTSDQFTFKTTTKTDKTISNDITVTIKSVFFVDAKVL